MNKKREYKVSREIWREIFPESVDVIIELIIDSINSRIFERKIHDFTVIFVIIARRQRDVNVTKR